MKIVSWNCNGKFREKCKIINKLDADIYIIQECENPQEYDDKSYTDFAANHFWIGDIKSKGLGIFWKDSVHLEVNDWPNNGLKYFISASVNHQFNVLAVWACKPYIEEYYDYQVANADHIKDSEIVIIGDFNSNRIFDKSHGNKCHSRVVYDLEQMGIHSVYHAVTGEVQGEETNNTFYLYRHPDKGFHIDHCFTNLEIQEYEVLDDAEWLTYSDHMPLSLIL